ncbi:MAG: hypothetical protein O7G85_06810, partial [Planctomycetota bacterium]|nr:hypothetical protein [Planctomycetota bacterium]
MDGEIKDAEGSITSQYERVDETRWGDDEHLPGKGACRTVRTMPLVLYNSLTKREEVFEPLDPKGRFVTYYSCGPTVYDYAHIGNFRSFLNADVMRRTLELLGYEVRHIMNMTDVGHMTDDDIADGGGEDKMEVAAKRLLEAKKSGA